MPKVYSKHHGDAPKNAVYVGRPSIWGNPFTIGIDGTREKVIQKYQERLNTISSDYRKKMLEPLRGKDLVCWCAPSPCHADILLELANAQE